MDPWWNPAVEEQAIDRAHRLGRTKPTFIYRLVTKGTVEERVRALQISKKETFQKILDGYKVYRVYMKFGIINSFLKLFIF